MTYEEPGVGDDCETDYDTDTDRELEPTTIASSSSQMHHNVDSRSQPETGLPSGWKLLHSNSDKRPYCYNIIHKSKVRKPPKGTNNALLTAYIAQYGRSINSRRNRLTELMKDKLQKSKLKGNIRITHILVKHEDGRKASNFKNSMSRNEAAEVIRAYKSKTESRQTVLPDRISTWTLSSLAYPEMRELQTEFEDAALSIEPSGWKNLIITASGVHLIEL